MPTPARPKVRSAVPRLPALTQANGAPRHQVIAQALMSQIEKGALKVGDMLPTELDICKQYGVSRYTAREAIKRLTDAGLVSRRAGIGTTIKAKAASSRYTASISDITDLIAFNRQTRLQILSESWVEIAGSLVELLPEAQGQRWYRITALRHIDGSPEPVAYTDILIHPAYQGIRDRIHEPGVVFYQLLEELHGERIGELRQETSSIPTPRAVAPLLGTRTGSPALQVLRYYVSTRDTLISLSINTYPHARFKVTTKWRLATKAEA
jgi:DNA-binding GntR family transcriptional regulator